MPNQTSQKASHSFGYIKLECTENGRLDLLCKELRKEFPKLRMQHKRRHWYWRALNWIVLIVTFGGNRVFNARYTTTVRKTIGWSDKQWERIRKKAQGWEDRIWSTLMHEREHLRQFKKYTTPIMGLGYIFVFFPIGLAYVRARFERAGYLQTLRCWYVLDRKWAEHPEARVWWIKQFTTGSYGWMLPFKKTVGRWFDQELKRLQELAADPTYS